jgi:hypothetical protein
VRDLVIITTQRNIHTHPTGEDQKRLTIPSLRFHNNVSFHHQMLQAGSLRHIEFYKGQMTDPGRPEALDSFRIFTPGLDENIEAGAILNRSVFKQFEYGIWLIVDQE